MLYTCTIITSLFTIDRLTLARKFEKIGIKSDYDFDNKTSKAKFQGIDSVKNWVIRLSGTLLGELFNSLHVG